MVVFTHDALRSCTQFYATGEKGAPAEVVLDRQEPELLFELPPGLYQTWTLKALASTSNLIIFT